MIHFHGKVNKDYAWELTLFNKVRSLKDGLTLFEAKANLDTYKADHNPKTELSLTVCNCVLIEFLVYNVHHAEEEDPWYDEHK